MDFVTRFLSFDKLMGASLVKVVYYLGMIGIACGVVMMTFTGFALNGFMGGIGALIAGVIGGLIGICFLRFACELYIVLFRIGDDIAAMRGTRGLDPANPPGPTLP